MEIQRSYAKWLFAAVASIALFIGVNTVHGRHEVKNVSAMTERMKTVCIGRFLIDLPQEAEVTIQPARVGGFNISHDEETTDQFMTWLDDREAELSSTLNMLNRKSLETSRELRGEGFVGRIFVHSRYRTYGIENGERKYHETVSIEGYVHKGGTTFSFDSEHDDPARVPVAAAMMTHLLSRTGDNIPNTPGFCINRAVLTGAPDNVRGESLLMFAGFPGHPDVTVAFRTNSAAKPGAGLLARSAVALDDLPLARARTRILRQRVRMMNGLAGEEFAIKATEFNFTTGYSFNWEKAGTGSDRSSPSVSLELHAGVNPRAGGKSVQSSLSEEGMLALWDKISSSIRMRPARPAKAAASPLRPATTALPTVGFGRAPNKPAAIETGDGVSAANEQGVAGRNEATTRA